MHVSEEHNAALVPSMNKNTPVNASFAPSINQSFRPVFGDDTIVHETSPEPRINELSTSKMNSFVNSPDATSG